MTEKIQFDFKDKYLTLNGGVFATARTKLDAELISKVINELLEENQQLKAQLLYDGEEVCNICKHQYLVESKKYYVAKCEKGHEECSKGTVRYCKDFKVLKE